MDFCKKRLLIKKMRNIDFDMLVKKKEGIKNPPLNLIVP